MKRTIFLKIFSGYFLITLILSALVLAFSFRIIRDHYVDTLTNSLKHYGPILKLKIIPFLTDKRFFELDSIVKRLGMEIQTRITIIDPDGVVLADSAKDPYSMGNHRNRPEIMQAFEGKIGESLRFSPTLQEEMLYVAFPIEGDKGLIGILRVSLFLGDINDLLGDLRSRILYIVLIVIGVSLFGAILLSRSLSKPIKNLAYGAQKIASGNFDARIFLNNKDELKELAESFNYMAEKINTLFKDISLQKDEHNIIISSLQECLLVLDKEGKIIICNESFKREFHGDFTQGMACCEVLRSSELNNLIKRITEQKRNLIEEVELNEKTFLCSASFITSKEEVVLILSDITDIKNLEKTKRDLVVNVSHELRTPLTAIKGFVKAMEDEIDQKQRRYLDIIKRHTERLINIISDLLLLSELEGPRFELERDDVDLKAMVEDVLRLFEIRLKEKGLRLTLNLDEDAPAIKADPFKLEQMFINLIENAINYTEKGEIKISIDYHGRHVQITIQDTGIGIPKEDLSRIFERFYVVDKSRSRRLGGTGLGLSIVKHIVLLHNGTIDVDSTFGLGTRFTVILPLTSS